MAKSFKTWVKQFIGDTTPLGDLANDIKNDVNFPVKNDWNTIWNYLNDIGAPYENMDAFDYAWTDYKKEIQA